MARFLGTAALTSLLFALPARAGDTAVTVWAFGASDKDEAARLGEALGKLTGVSQAAVEEISADGARLKVSLAHGDGVALAKAIDEAPGLALRVEQSSPERVLTRTGPSKSARVPFRMKLFEDKSKDKKLADVATLATETLRVLLQNAPFLVEAPNPDDALLVFTGRVSKEDKTLVYEVRILRAKSGEISYGKGKGEAALSEVIQQMVKALPQRLAELESAHFQKDAALMALPKAMERARRGFPLRLVKSEGRLDPSQVAQYGAEPLATLWLEDAGGKAITGAMARARVEGLSTGVKDNGPVDIKPGAPAKIQVLASLDTERVAKASGPSIAPLKVDVTYKQGDLDRVATFVVPVRVGAPL